MKCPCCGGDVNRQIIISLEQSVLAVGDKKIRVSPREAELLATLIRAMPGTARHAQIIGDLWPNPDDEPENVESNIKVVVCGLRRLMEGVMMLTNVPGIGYRLDPFDPEATTILNKRLIASTGRAILEAAHAR